jgi:uncharacterized protein YndB with AHSA1/START domain
MAVVTVERHLDRPIERVWSLVTDVAALRLPLTHVEADPGPPGPGWHFVGVSGIGPLVLRDPMVVTTWVPPGDGRTTAEYAVVKTGRVLAGWADVVLTACTPSSTRLRWREQIVLRPRPLGVALAVVTDVAVRAMFERAVDDLVARA